MTLYLRESGLIRHDTFAGGIPTGYAVSPAGRVTVQAGKLKLDHDNSEDTRALVAISGACAVEIVADYTPTEANDEGGLLLFKNATEVVEFVEQQTSAVSTTVAKWKAGSVNGTDWDLYADSGAGYSFVDTAAEFTPTKVGAVLKKGTAANFVPLLLDRITITKSDVLVVGNVGIGMTVELLNASNQVVATTTTTTSTALLKMNDLIVTGKLRVKNGATVTLEVSGTFYGGDRYDSGSSLKLVLDNVTRPELSTVSPTDIGLMGNGKLERKLYIYNPGGTAVSSVSIAVEQFNARFGYQWVDIALDNAGAPGAYSDAISYTSIAAGATVPFWVKVTQGTDYTGLDPLQYALNVSHI